MFSCLLIALIFFHLYLHFSQELFFSHYLIHFFIDFTVILFFDLITYFLEMFLSVISIKFKFLCQSVSHSTLNICFLMRASKALGYTWMQHASHWVFMSYIGELLFLNLGKLQPPKKFCSKTCLIILQVSFSWIGSFILKNGVCSWFNRLNLRNRVTGNNLLIGIILANHSIFWIEWYGNSRPPKCSGITK